MSSVCVLRSFSSLENRKCTDLGKFFIGTRASDNGKNIVLQLRGDKLDPDASDTGFFACLFPYEAAKLYIELEEKLLAMGFNIESFVNNYEDKHKQSSDDAYEELVETGNSENA